MPRCFLNVTVLADPMPVGRTTRINRAIILSDMGFLANRCPAARRHLDAAQSRSDGRKPLYSFISPYYSGDGAPVRAVKFKGDRVRVGVIGCGNWGQNHARTLASMSVLGAVADLVPARREQLAAELGCRSHDADTLIADPQLDAVVVALPPAHQAPMALRVLRAGKHLLVEKPMALDAGQACQIDDLARSTGLVAMTGHLLLFHTAYQALTAMVAGGELGSLRHIRTVRAGQGRFYPGTDVIWDLLPHDLSLLRDLMGALPDAAESQLQSVAVVSELADVASLQMSYCGGPVVNCLVSRVAPQRERRMLVQGSLASVLWDENEDWSRRLCVATNPSPDNPTTTPRFIPLVPAQPLEAQLRHFLDSIRNKTVPRGTVTGGYDVLRFIHALDPIAAKQTGLHHVADALVQRVPAAVTLP